MHTTDATKVKFFHNGDYSGDVKVLNKETGQEMEIPFDDVKTLVAGWVRDQKIESLEQATADELLLQNAAGHGCPASGHPLNQVDGRED